MKNHGLIHEQIPPNVGFIGGVAGELPDLMPTGDWEPHLPEYEKQQKMGLETMNCVQFSRLNVCETQARFYGKPLNLSDRFLYWAAGCTANGNTFTACDYWIKQRGSCLESLWPWLVPMDRAEYGKEPPADVQAEAKKLLEVWTVGMLVWVPTTIEGMKAALKKGPLWVCNQFHAFQVFRIDDRIRVFDQYGDDAGGKGSFPLSYVDQLVAAYLAPFTPKNLTPQPSMNYPKNCLVVVVDGLGERMINADNTKLIKDDPGAIDLELDARNSVPCPEATCKHCEPGKYVPHRQSSTFPVVHVKTADVAGVPRVNLKGQPV